MRKSKMSGGHPYPKTDEEYTISCPMCGNKLTKRSAKGARIGIQYQCPCGCHAYVNVIEMSLNVNRVNTIEGQVSIDELL